MSNFRSPETGDFDKYFMTTTELIDRFAQGGLWNWGIASLGDNTTTNKSSPVQTIAGGTNWKQVSCGYNNSNTAAIKTDGTLWLWGYNTRGQLGDSTTTDKSSPVQTICGGTNWKQVSCGREFTMAIKTDGTLWGWGQNNYGQLGSTVYPTTFRSSPIQTICQGTNWKQVSCGGVGNFTMAIKTDGTLWGWGDNQNQPALGNPYGGGSSPIQTIAGGTSWKQVSCGGDCTAAIKTDGTLWTWGKNVFGQLGDSTTTNRSSPIQTICGGTNWKQVSCGGSSMAAIKTDSTLWLWGQSFSGQLGDSTLTHRSSPVQTIAGGTNWKQVSIGNSHTAAIKTDGTLWLWGSNAYYGMLGDSTLTNRSSPVQTIAGGTNWKQVACGSSKTAAIQYSDIGQVL